MNNSTIPVGTVHDLPDDLHHALQQQPDALVVWGDITPLARNEWLCWVESVKLDKTRQLHIKRAVDELAAGKRRPCCWPGCPHRQRSGN